MKNKLVFGGAIIVVFLGVMGYLLTQSNVAYEENFAEVMKMDKTVKATGFWVEEKDYMYDKDSRTFTFYIKDAFGTEMKVVYNGPIPNNFESATSVVITGKYEHGIFQAREILTKCPSKYEEKAEDVKAS